MGKVGLSDGGGRHRRVFVDCRLFFREGGFIDKWFKLMIRLLVIFEIAKEY